MPEQLYVEPTILQVLETGWNNVLDQTINGYFILLSRIPVFETLMFKQNLVWMNLVVNQPNC